MSMPLGDQQGLSQSVTSQSLTRHRVVFIMNPDSIDSLTLKIFYFDEFVTIAYIRKV